MNPELIIIYIGTTSLASALYSIFRHNFKHPRPERSVTSEPEPGTMAWLIEIDPVIAEIDAARQAKERARLDSSAMHKAALTASKYREHGDRSYVAAFMAEIDRIDARQPRSLTTDQFDQMKNGYHG